MGSTSDHKRMSTDVARGGDGHGFNHGTLQRFGSCRKRFFSPLGLGMAQAHDTKRRKETPWTP